MFIRVKAPGSCGELLQGAIDGEPFLVTCPIDLYAEVVVSSGQSSCAGLGCKAEQALIKLLRQRNLNEYPYRIQLRSDLPVGKGMASSSADIAATCQAAATSLGKPLHADEIARIAASIEPTDGIFYEGVVVFHHLNGIRRESLGIPPMLRIAVFDTGGSVDTLCFNQRNDLMELYRQNESQLVKALALLKKGIKSGDMRMIGQSATISACANQSILHKPCLEEMIRIAEETGGVGVNIAHSGTVIGMLFDPSVRKNINTAVQLVKKRLPQLRLIKIVRLISGGLVIEGDING